MRLIVTLEERFAETPDGTVWSGHMSGYKYWLPYLQVFDELCIVARVARVTHVDGPHWQRATGPGVTFHRVAAFIGPAQYAKHYFAVGRQLAAALRDSDAVLLRVPATFGGRLRSRLRPHRPFGLEVVGDPWEVYSSASIRVPFRRLLRKRFTDEL